MGVPAGHRNRHYLLSIQVKLPTTRKVQAKLRQATDTNMTLVNSEVI